MKPNQSFSLKFQSCIPRGPNVKLPLLGVVPMQCGLANGLRTELKRPIKTAQRVDPKKKRKTQRELQTINFVA